MKTFATFALLTAFAGSACACVNVAVLASIPDGAEDESHDADGSSDEIEPRADVEEHDAKDDHEGDHLQDALELRDDDHSGTDR